MRDKTKFAAIAAVAIAIIAGITVFSLWTLLLGEPIIYNIASFGVAVAIIVLAIGMLLQLRRNIKSGLPMEDERSKRVKAYAGYYTYLVSLYLLLGLMFYSLLGVDVFGVPELTVTGTIMLVLIAMLAIFCSFWMYFTRRGIE
jgi:uncharacterized membrane protein